MCTGYWVNWREGGGWYQLIWLKSAFDRKWVEFLKKSKLSFELLRKLVVKYSPMVVAASLRGIKINTWWLCVIDWIPGRTP